MFPTVKIIPGKGASGQSKPGQDYVSGQIFYCADNKLPSGFSTVARVKQIFGIADAIALGILNDNSDETQATLHFTVTAAATNGGNIITVKWNDPILGSITLCTYTTLNTDTTPTILGASIAAAITANKSTTGFSAVSSTGTLTITVRKGLGIYPNANYAQLTAVVTGTDIGGNATVGAVTLGASGVASLLAVWYYHISEYFRINPNGNLFVGFFLTPANVAAYTYADVETLQTAALGIIRQIAVYAPVTYAANAADANAFIVAAVAALQTRYTNIFNAKTPAQILFACDMMKLVNVSALTQDLGLLAGNRVSVVIYQDGANNGYALSLSTGYSITGIGSALGVTSLASVSDDIGDLGQFNLTSLSELSVPAFATQELVKNISAGLITQLDLWRYIFVTTYQGYTGVYINNDHCACPYSDQFAYIHFGRTWDKAARLLYSAYLPYLKAKFSLAANGSLSPTTQAVLQQAGQMALDPMVQQQDLSGYTVAVPSNQNPNTTGKLAVTVNLLAMAIANEIDITSTFVASL